MTITEPITGTDQSVLGVTIPAELASRAQQSSAEIRALLSDARPIIERARAVYAEAEQVSQDAYLAAKLLTDDIDALDGVGALVSGLSGSLVLHAALSELSAAADPDE